ncbi:MAG: M48 family metallopeptidase [Pseudomonadota bacterium]
METTGPTSVSGQYFSGETSASTPVTLKAVGNDLIIEGLAEPMAVPLADIDVEAPLAGMPQHVRLPGGAQIEVDGSHDISPWFARHSRLERMVHWLERRWPVAVASLAITAVTVWALYTYALPATATVVASNMPLSWKRGISEESVQLLRQLGFFKSRIDLERQKAIRQRFAPMVADLPDPEQYTLEFRHAPIFGPNAFAMPGGRMVVLDDLIELTDENDEIVAVLAHELGHAYYQHPMRMAIQSSALGLIVAVAIGDASGLASLPLIGLQANYSRKFEAEADDFAIEALQKAGISPQALADIFQRLMDEYGLEGTGESWLDSHPALEKRIKKASEAAN